MMHSFISVKPDSYFPIQNLPYGVFYTGQNAAPRVGVAIGDQILDLSVIESAGLLPINDGIFSQASINRFLEQGKAIWDNVRQTIQTLLASDCTTLRDDSALRTRALVAQSDATLLIPVEIGDYTDFYSSREHATNVGSMFRDPNNALLPNWLHLPVAYHGRASSVVVSGTDIFRPNGQTRPNNDAPPIFGPSNRMDFELELGCIIGKGNALGDPIPAAEAADHIFGFVLVNDWSARDIQKWEYIPLGPFLAKNVGTTISPWIVPMAALEPFRTHGPTQDAPLPLPYLQTTGANAYDIQLDVQLQSSQMSEPVTIAQSNSKYLYWNMAQQIAHHTITGCNLRPGDLLASGTISGPTPDSYGSLLELTWSGKNAITLPDGTQRTFMQDGDTLTLAGFCQGDGYRVGFGEASGTLLPAKSL